MLKRTRCKHNNKSKETSTENNTNIHGVNKIMFSGDGREGLASQPAASSQQPAASSQQPGLRGAGGRGEAFRSAAPRQR